MKLLDGGCRVYSPGDGEISTEGNRTARAVICHATGAKLITQTVAEYARGLSKSINNANAEEALYIARGQGACLINGSRHHIRPGAALYIPPDTAYSIENTRPDPLTIISSSCPVRTAKPAATALIHEDDREQIRAGEDRIFRYLVHTDIGSRQITQFVGWIPQSKAPFHHHTYEEAIYVLEGNGILHLKDHLAAAEFSPGSSIYFPAGVVHCLENPGPGAIRLLGVFYPSGSPGEAYEDD